MSETLRLFSLRMKLLMFYSSVSHHHHNKYTGETTTNSTQTAGVENKARLNGNSGSLMFSVGKNKDIKHEIGGHDFWISYYPHRLVVIISSFYSVTAQPQTCQREVMAHNSQLSHFRV